MAWPTWLLVVLLLAAIAWNLKRTQRRLGPRPDLSHLHPGQRWVFATCGGQVPDTVWTIRAVDAAAGSVEYEEASVRGGKAIEPPTVERWTTATHAPPSVGTTRRQAVTLAGRSFDCDVTELDGLVLWLPVRGDWTDFPGRVRFEAGERVTTELVRIEDAGSGPPIEPFVELGPHDVRRFA